MYDPAPDLGRRAFQSGKSERCESVGVPTACPPVIEEFRLGESADLSEKADHPTMKQLYSFLAVVAFSQAPLFAQKPAPAIPDQLKPAFEILKATYPKVDAQKSSKPPADSAWLFRSATGGTGTVEVGFQGANVVYMVFRKGVGGKGWSPDEISAIHRQYTSNLLKEEIFGQLYRRMPEAELVTQDVYRLRYGNRRIGEKREVSTQNNAAFIARRDFDTAALTSGL